MTSSAKLALPDAPRLLVARPDRVGDVILSTSCIAPIRQRYPRCQVFFFAAERMRPLLDGHPELAGFVSNTAEIPGLQLDAVVHLHPDAACYRAAWQARVPVRIGYHQRFLNRSLTRSLPDKRAVGLKHEAAHNFDLLQFLGVQQPARLVPNIHLTNASLDSLQSKLPWDIRATRFAVLNPSAHSKVARWPIEHFLQLADWLRNKLDLEPVFIGADAKDSIPNRAAQYLNLAEKTDLGELGWLLKHAQLLVTRDTGPSHLAAAVDCPVVVIFGRTDPIYGPTRWRPLTDKAIIVTKPLPKKMFEKRDVYWRRCFAAISVEEVKEAVLKALAFQR